MAVTGAMAVLRRVGTAQADLPRAGTVALHTAAGRRWMLVIFPRLLAAVAVVAVAAMLARLTWIWIEGGPAMGTAHSVKASLAGSSGGSVDLAGLGLFGEVARRASPKPRPVSGRTAHNLHLSGVYLASGAASYAMLAPPNVIPLVYAVGDAVQPGITVTAIHADHVLLDNNGHSERLALPDGSGSLGVQVKASAPPVSGGDVVVVDKLARRKLERYRKQLLGNPLAVAGVIQGVPVVRNGQVVGFRLSNGRDPTLMEQLGLRTNDVLKKLNDIPVGDASRIGDLLKLVAEARRFELQLERNNADELLTIYLDG